MGKVLAIVGVFFFLKWAIPLFAAGTWIAPAPVPPDWWGFQSPYLAAQVINRPTANYSLERFDFWNQL